MIVLLFDASYRMICFTFSISLSKCLYVINFLLINYKICFFEHNIIVTGFFFKFVYRKSPNRKQRHTMSDRKAVIKNADMSEEMQQDAVDCATQALEKYNIEKVCLTLKFLPDVIRLENCYFVKYTFIENSRPTI